MNLSELQAFLEESNWDEHPFEARARDDSGTITNLPDTEAEPVVQDDARKERPMKLVPKLSSVVHSHEPELRASDSVKDRLTEIEMAQKMGYLLCKCTWPPQIMVLTGTEHVYRCRRCSRVREM